MPDLLLSRRAASRHPKARGTRRDPPGLLGPELARAFARQVLLDEQKGLRTSARLGSVDEALQVKARKRQERLLLDTLIYLSAQGQAAFDGDASREARYRLDHIYGRKASAAGDPGAGGTEGDPQASSPASDDSQARSSSPSKI